MTLASGSDESCSDVAIFVSRFAGTLCEERVVEDGEPIGGVAIARHDRRSARIALDEELIDISALFARHRLECEIIHDE